MATKLGDLILELGIDDGKMINQLNAAKKKALDAGKNIEKDLLKGAKINEALKLTPTTDEKALYELNDHLKLKAKHVREINAEWQTNPLTPRVNNTEIDGLSRKLDALGNKKVEVGVDDRTESNLKKELSLGLSSDIQSLQLQIADLSTQVEALTSATRDFSNGLDVIKNQPGGRDKVEKIKDVPQIAYDRRSGNYRWTQGQDRGKFVSREDLSRLREEKGLWTPMARSDRQIQYSERNARKFNAVLEATFAPGVVEEATDAMGGAIQESVETGVREGIRPTLVRRAFSVLGFVVSETLGGALSEVGSFAFNKLMGDRIPKEVVQLDMSSAKEAFKPLEDQIVNLGDRLATEIEKGIRKGSEPTAFERIGNFLTGGLFTGIKDVVEGLYEEIGAGFGMQIGSGLVKAFEETFDINLSEFGNEKGKRLFPVVREGYKRSEAAQEFVGDSAKVIGERMRLAGFRLGDGIIAAIDEPRVVNKVGALFKGVDTSDLSSAIGEMGDDLNMVARDFIDSMTNGMKELPFLDEMLRSNRMLALRERAAPRVQQRVAELTDPNYQPDDKFQRNRKGNALKAVKEDTEELFIVTSGYTGTEGKAGRRFVMPPMGGKNNPSYIKPGEGQAFVAIDNVDSDIPSDDKSGPYATAYSMAKPNLRGFSPDSIEMVSQAMAALSKNPEIKIKFMGESGGGFVAEEAYVLSQLMGLKDVEYLGLGTPDMIGRLDTSQQGKVMSKDDKLDIGFVRKWRQRGFASDYHTRQGARGAFGHTYDAYAEQGTAELEQFLRPMELDEDGAKAALETAAESLRLIREASKVTVNEVVEAQKEIDSIIRANPDLAEAKTNLDFAKSLVKDIDLETADEDQYQEYMDYVSEPQEVYDELEAEYLSDAKGRKTEAVDNQLKVIKDAMTKLQLVRQLAMAAPGKLGEEFQVIADQIDAVYVDLEGLDDVTQGVTQDILDVESFINSVNQEGVSVESIQQIPEMREKIKNIISEARKLRKEPQDASGLDLSGTRIDYLTDIEQRAKESLATIKDPSFGVNIKRRGGDEPVQGEIVDPQPPPIDPSGDPGMEMAETFIEVIEANAPELGRMMGESFRDNIRNAFEAIEQPQLVAANNAPIPPRPTLDQLGVDMNPQDERQMTDSPYQLAGLQELVGNLERGVLELRDIGETNPSTWRNQIEGLQEIIGNLENQARYMIALIPSDERTKSEEVLDLATIIRRLERVEQVQQQLADSLTVTNRPPPSSVEALRNLGGTFTTQKRQVLNPNINEFTRQQAALGILSQADTARQSISDLEAQYGDDIPDPVRRQASAAKGQITKAVKDANKALEELGVNLEGSTDNVTGGIVEGINNGISGVEAAISQMAQRGTDAAEDTWEIRSPSRVFMRIGKSIVDGFRKGMDDGLEETLDQKLQGVKSILTETTKGGFTFEQAFSGQGGQEILDLALSTLEQGKLPDKDELRKLLMQAGSGTAKDFAANPLLETRKGLARQGFTVDLMNQLMGQDKTALGYAGSGVAKAFSIEPVRDMVQEGVVNTMGLVGSIAGSPLGPVGTLAGDGLGAIVTRKVTNDILALYEAMMQGVDPNNIQELVKKAIEIKTAAPAIEKAKTNYKQDLTGWAIGNSFAGLPVPMSGAAVAMYSTADTVESVDNIRKGANPKEELKNLGGKLGTKGINFTLERVKQFRLMMEAEAEVIDELNNNLEDISNTYIAKISTFVGRQYSNLQDAINDPQAAGSAIAGNLKNFFDVDALKGDAAKVDQITQSIMEGIEGGLSETGVAEDQARSLAQSILDAAKAELGISSPSKEFIEIGRMIVAGLELGVSEFRASKIGQVLESKLMDLKSQAEEAVKSKSQDVMNYASELPAEVAPKLENLLNESVSALQGFTGDTAGTSSEKLSTLADKLQTLRESAFNPDDQAGNWELKTAQTLDEIIQKLNEASSAAGIYSQAMDAASGKADLDETIESVAQQTEEAAKNTGFLGKAMDNIKGIAGNILKIFIGWQVLSRLGEFMQEFAMNSLAAAVEFEKIETTLTFVVGGFDAAQSKIRELRDEANALGVDARSNIEGYVQLAAATRDTTLEGTATDQISSAVTQASAAYLLDPQEAERVNLAISQMASKGRVSSEELRQQLGEVLPGAFQIAARSIGVTTQELDKMLARGEVVSDEFLPRFAQQLSAETAAGVAGAANTAQASMNRLRNEIDELQVGFGKQILPVQQFGTEALAKGLSVLVELMPMLLGIGITVIVSLVDSFIGLGRIIDLVRAKVLGLGIDFNKMGQMGAAGMAKAAGAALGSLMKSIGMLATQFLVIQTVISTVSLAFAYFNDQSGEVGDIADSSSRRLEMMKERLDGIAESATKAADRLQDVQLRGTAGSILQDGIIGGFTDQVQENRQEKNTGILGGINNAINFVADSPFIAAGALRNRFAAKQQEDTRNAIDQLRETSSQAMANAETFLTGDNQQAIDQFIEIDKQLKSIQRQQQAVRALNPENVKELERLSEIEAEILESRKEAVGELENARSEIDKQLKERQDALEAIEAANTRGELLPEEYEYAVKSLTGEIADLEKQQNAFNDRLDTSITKFNEISRELERIQAASADAQFFSGLESSVARTAVANSTGPGQQGTLEFSEGIVSQDEITRNLQAQQQELASTIAQLQTEVMQDAINTLKSQVPNIETLGPNELARLQQEFEEIDSAPELQKALETLGRTKELEAAVAESTAQVAEARQQLEEQLFEAQRQLSDYYQEVYFQTREIEQQAKELANDRNLTQASSNIKSVMSEFRGTFFSGFMETLQEFFDVLNKELQESMQYTRDKLALVQEFGNQLRQQQDMQMGLPGVAQGGNLGGAMGAGTLVGIGGDTGRSTGPHLDIRYTRNYDPNRNRPTDEHLNRFAINGTPLGQAQITSEHRSRNRGRPGHDGIDYAVNVGDKLTTTVPIASVSDPWWDDGGGGWVTTVRFEDGVEMNLLHQDPSVRNAALGSGGQPVSQQPSSAQQFQGLANTASRMAVSASGLTVKGAQMTDDQLQYARVIAGVGQDLGASVEEIQVAIATAIQESTLRNLSGGDRDSAGLFQQRPSMEWGQFNQITDPRFAAESFFQGRGSNVGLLDTRGRSNDPYARSHMVQRSAHPDAPRRWDSEAAAITQAVIGSGGGSVNYGAMNQQIAGMQGQLNGIGQQITENFNQRRAMLDEGRNIARGANLQALDDAITKMANAGIEASFQSQIERIQGQRSSIQQAMGAELDLTPMEEFQYNQQDLQLESQERLLEAQRNLEVARNDIQVFTDYRQSAIADMENAGASREQINRVTSIFDEMISAAQARIPTLEQNLADAETYGQQMGEKLATDFARAEEERILAQNQAIAQATQDQLEQMASILDREGKPTQAAELRAQAQMMGVDTDFEAQLLDLERKIQAGQINPEVGARLRELYQDARNKTQQNLLETLQRDTEEIIRYNEEALAGSAQELGRLQAQAMRRAGDPFGAMQAEQAAQLAQTQEQFTAQRQQILFDVRLDENTRQQLLSDLAEVEKLTLDNIASLNERTKIQIQLDIDQARFEGELANLEAMIPNLNYNFESGRARDMQAELDAMRIQLDLRQQLQSINDPENNLDADTREYLSALAEETAELKAQTLERQNALQVQRDQIDLARNALTGPGGPMEVMSLQDEYLGMFGVSKPTYQMQQERLPYLEQMQNLDFQTKLLELEELREAGKIGEEQFNALSESLARMNEVKLDKLRQEASGIPEIVSSFKGPMEGAIKSILDGSATVGEAFSSMVDGIISNLASLAAEWVTNALFTGMFGGGVGAQGEGSWLNSMLGSDQGIIPAPVEEETGLLGGVLGGGDVAAPLVAGSQQAGMTIVQAGQTFAMTIQQAMMGASVGTSPFGAIAGALGGGLSFGSSPFSFLGGNMSKPNTGLNFGSTLDLSFDKGARSIGNAILESSNKGGSFFGNAISGVLGGGGFAASAPSGGGGLFGSGGGSGIFGSVLQMGLSFLGGFNSGGEVVPERGITIRNFGKGGSLDGVANKAIEEAFKRERPYGEPELIMAHKGEYVLTRKQAKRYKQLGLDKYIENYAKGGMVGGNNFVSPTFNAPKSENSISVPVNINMQSTGNATDDKKAAKNMQSEVSSLIYSVLIKESKPGGRLYNGGR